MIGRRRRTGHLVLWILVLLFSTSAPVRPRAADAVEAKVALSLEPSESAAPRGGMLPLDIFAEIEAGWHIHSNAPSEPYLIPTEVKLVLPPTVTAEPLQYPPADRKTFQFAQGKELLVYEGKLGVATAIHIPAEFPGSKVRVEATLRYQACNDSVCLPPTTATAELVLPVSIEVPTPIAPGRTTSAPSSPAGSVEQWLDERGLLFTFLAVALLGVGLNLTPCVYPLISVTVAYFGGHDRGNSLTTLLLAGTYVLGIALSFSLLGLAAALSGGLFGAALQKPAVLLFLAGVMVALSLSSFGVYQIRPPAALMRWAGGSARGYGGAAFMGLTMGVVAAPCIGPIVLALLVAVGSRQDPFLGFGLFFALGAGMGLPYVLLAMAAGSIGRLPRSGEWLVWVEKLFGFVLLAMAAYFVRPLVAAPLRDLLLPLVAGVAGIYLGFLDRSGGGMPAFPSIKRATGIAALAFAAWIGWLPPIEAAIRWQDLSSASLEALHRSQRPVVIDFGAEWCIPCVEMAHTTFVDSKVVRQAERFDMLRADVTEENEESRKLLEAFDVRGVPTVLVFDSKGNEVGRMVGYTGPEELLEAMRKAA
jgi:thiol:disulfide interchange protein DsbD